MFDIETENRFWSKILTGDEDECWECVGTSIDKDGYGIFNVKYTKLSAHRFSYQLYHNRLIHDGMVILHRCDNPSCVNPKHLSEGTPKDNVHDMIDKGRYNKGISLKGEDCGRAKLTEKQVLEIRAKYTKSGITYKVLGIEYKIGESTVRSIINRKSWTHI